jgi:hypothetical protein
VRVGRANWASELGEGMMRSQLEVEGAAEELLIEVMVVAGGVLDDRLAQQQRRVNRKIRKSQRC